MAPFILLVVGLPEPWPLFALVMAAIYGSKTFYKMVGMYHRSWFVMITYAFIFLLGYLVYHSWNQLYVLTPMLFLACISLVPLLRNSAKYMIQYLALSLMAFIFFGWCFLYTGRLLMLDGGIFIVLYLYILVEFSENVSLAATRFLGKTKPFSNISSRISTEGMVIAMVVTLAMAWGIRPLLPDSSEMFWVSAGIIATLFGRFGDLIIAVIRRDLGIKDSGVFIIGRDDIIARMDKLFFVAPLYYYSYLYLTGQLTP